jgi:hypothetical protein
MIKYIIRNNIKTLSFIIFVLFATVTSENLFAQNVLLLEGKNLDSAARINTLLISSITAGESLILLGVLNYKQSIWATPKNNILGFSDILIGSTLGYMALYEPDLGGNTLFYTLAAASTLTHSYRNYEIFADTENPFCFNTPLVIFNNIKLAGTLSSIGLVWYGTF